MVTVTFVCGHTRTLTGNEQAPCCGQCPETQIAKVVAPPPVFTGHAQGPCATYQDLPAIPVTLGETHE